MAGSVKRNSVEKKEVFFCYVDCRVDNSLTNDFLNLNIWGKTVYRYALDTILLSDVFDHIIVITDSPQIRRSLMNEAKVSVQSDLRLPLYDSIVCVISGRAVMMSSDTIRKACSVFCSGIMYSAKVREKVDYLHPYNLKSFLNGYDISPGNAFVFYQIRNGEIKADPITEYHLDSDEAVVINSVNDFELSIVLKKKELNKSLLRKAILARIEEKRDIFSAVAKSPTICLVGHSQIDYWDTEYLAGYRVKNCGIAGISSFEYAQLILEKEMLDCSSDIFVVMHGTNDIVLDQDIDKIVQSILETVYYIRKRNEKALIYFLSCMHTNGRLDRDNRKINELNIRLEKEFKNSIKYVDTKFMDNEFGELDIRNTIDGLHLSDRGYKILQEHIEACLLEDV